MAEKKYTFEKVMHEFIRNNSESQMYNNLWRKGFLTVDEMIIAIMNVYKKENERT